MDIYVWSLLASVLLASSQALRYDLGPQRFQNDNPSSTSRPQTQGTKEVVLYLTPSQVKALEEGGAVIRTQTTEPEPAPQQEEQPAEEPQQNAEPEQNEQNEGTEEEIRPVSDLEEIFRILNEQIEGQQRTETENGDQPEEEQQNEEANGEDDDDDNNNEDSSERESEENSEENSEEDSESESEEETESDSDEEQEQEEKKEVVERPRDVPARFRFVAKTQTKKAKKQDKYVAPIVAKKNKEQAKNYAYVRFVPNNQNEEVTLQVVNTNEQQLAAEPEQQTEEQINPVTENPGTPTNQLVPYEVTEKPEEPTPAEEEIEVEEIEARLAALLTPLINHEKIAESINEQKKKLVQNELEIQTLLRELTQAPKHNNQKYAIGIERLKANLERQNALAKAEALARTATTSAPIIREEAIKTKSRLVQASKSGKTRPVPLTTLARLKQSAEAKNSQVEVVKAVPVKKTAKQKAEKSGKLQTQKRVPVTITKYVKVPKAYPVQRVIPVEIKREIPITHTSRKSEKSTVLRPVWEH